MNKIKQFFAILVCKHTFKSRFLKLIGIILLLFLLEIGVISIMGYRENYPPCAMAVVLGNQVLPSGVPSQRLAGRLDKAVLLYQQGKIGEVMVSGGIGKEGFDEAKVMKDYLVAKGIPAEKITTDNQGNTTRLTAQNCAVLLQNYKSQNLLLISQFYHLARCKIAFQQAGFQQVYTAKADYYEPRDVYSLAREAVGIWAYLWGDE